MRQIDKQSDRQIERPKDIFTCISGDFRQDKHMRFRNFLRLQRNSTKNMVNPAIAKIKQACLYNITVLHVYLVSALTEVEMTRWHGDKISEFKMKNIIAKGSGASLCIIQQGPYA